MRCMVIVGCIRCAESSCGNSASKNLYAIRGVYRLLYGLFC
ncbi:hypothetical protein JCM19238_3444 [Vibrio ponticus]|nr:hypothetical protein JCM19238_3444 [Vibrio ponticus]